MDTRNLILIWHSPRLRQTDQLKKSLRNLRGRLLANLRLLQVKRNLGMSNLKNILLKIKLKLKSRQNRRTMEQKEIKNDNIKR